MDFEPHVLVHRRSLMQVSRGEFKRLHILPAVRQVRNSMFPPDEKKDAFDAIAKSVLEIV